MYSYFVSYLGFCSTEEDQIYNVANPTFYTSYTVNTIPADAPVT